MVITVPGVSIAQGVNVMRRAGYALERARDTGEISFARRLSGIPFPRFHAYTDESDSGLVIKLHLDQKAPTYRGTSAHAGEYEGDTIAREVERINSIIAKGGWDAMPDID